MDKEQIFMKVHTTKEEIRFFPEKGVFYKIFFVRRINNIDDM